MTLSVMSAGNGDCCKWCKRDFGTTLNPLLPDAGPGDLLPRRRPRGLECSPCDNFIDVDPELAKLGRKALAIQLESQVAQRKFNNDLAVFEDHKRKGHKFGRARRSDTSIKAYASSELETKMCLGTFWPANVFLKFKGEKPDPNKNDNRDSQRQEIAGHCHG